MIDENISLNELYQQLRKPHFYVRKIQNDLGLYIPSKKEGYGPHYLNFLKKIVSLRTFSVSMEKIQDCLKKEIKILTLLHYDSINPSPTWFFDGCTNVVGESNTLLLTGFDLGFPIRDGVIQCNLDFRERNAELFNGQEMGEDIRKVLDEYLAVVELIRERAYLEMPVLESALIWLEQAF